MSPRPAFIAFPRLEAYGDGGFRLDGARREGSILILNGAVEAWDVTAPGDLALDHFAAVFAADPAPELVLLGMGARMAAPPAEVRTRFREAAIGLEFMDTGAACRLYQTLVGEGRLLAAALIAVE